MVLILLFLILISEETFMLKIVRSSKQRTCKMAKDFKNPTNHCHQKEKMPFKIILFIKKEKNIFCVYANLNCNTS